ncbi:MAG: hypothetical protein ABEN55_09355 [Bradymonadaceae bacterium]
MDVWPDDKAKDKKESVPKPIVYHLNAQYPRDMIPAAKEVQKQWDKAMKEAVQLKAQSDDSIELSPDGQDLKAGMDRLWKKYRNDPEALEGTTLRPEHIEAYGKRKMFYIRKNSCLPGPLAKWKKNHGATTDSDRKNPQKLFDNLVGEIPDSSNLKEELWSVPVEERVEMCAQLEWATAQRDDPAARFTYQRRGDIR